METEIPLLNDMHLWYAVAVVIAVVIIYYAARTPILAWLDGEIAKVRAELDEAKRLHAEATATLQDYRNRQSEASKEAEEIVRHAKLDAARLQVEAKAELDATLARLEQLALDRIRLAQENAVAEVRAYVIEEAMVEARGKLNKMAAGPESVKLMDRIIADLPKLTTKSKVA